MAGGTATKSTTGGKGARGAGGAPAAKSTPRGGWQFADLSDPAQKASYVRQLQASVDAGRLESVDRGLEAVRKVQRAQNGSGGFASDDPEPKAAPEPSAPSPPAGRTPAKAGGSLPTPSLRPPSHLSAADGGGFLLGLMLFALGQSYLRYGAVGVTSWFGAKFLNKPAASVVAAEAKRGIAPKSHAALTTPGAGAAPKSFLTGKAPKGTPTVPPTERFGR